MALLPYFLKWSRDYPLSIDDVSLRHKNWLELVPPTNREDSDAIWECFFIEKKNGVKKFTAGTTLDLILALPYETYTLALAHSLADSEMVCAPRFTGIKFSHWCLQGLGLKSSGGRSGDHAVEHAEHALFTDLRRTPPVSSHRASKQKSAAEVCISIISRSLNLS